MTEEVNLESLAKASEGMVGADIEAICRRASMLAIREFINQGRKDLNKFKISTRHFNEALEAMKKAKG